MKLGLSLSFQIHKPPEAVALGQVFAIVFLVLSGAWLAWTIYTTAFESIYAPRTIDPSQVTEKQEKVNRLLLNTVTQKDLSRRQQTDFSALDDPFTP